MKKRTLAIVLFWVAIAMTLMVWLLSGCFAENPYPDFVFHAHSDQDSIITDPVQLPPDTCVNYVDLADTSFICLSAVFDNSLVLPTLQNINDRTGITFFDFNEFFNYYWPQYSYTIYPADKAICVFVDGTDDLAQFQGLIRVIDPNNAKTGLTAFKDYIAGRGALTFDQEKYEATHRLNIDAFDFWNTQFTPEQYNELGRLRCHFDLCALGGKLADFHYAIGISPTIPDSADLYHWLRVKRP